MAVNSDTWPTKSGLLGTPFLLEWLAWYRKKALMLLLYEWLITRMHLLMFWPNYRANKIVFGVIRWLHYVHILRNVDTSWVCFRLRTRLHTGLSHQCSVNETKANTRVDDMNSRNWWIVLFSRYCVLVIHLVD